MQFAPQGPRAAADAGDLNVLADALWTHPPDPTDGAALLRHTDPRVVELVIGWLRGHVRRCADVELRRRWAEALPRDLATLGPRGQRGLARLYLQLLPYVSKLPDWRGLALSEPVALAWLTTAVHAGGAAITIEGPTERLVHALAAIYGAQLNDLEGVQTALLALSAARPALGVAGLRLLDEAYQVRTIALADAQVWWRRWLTIDAAATLALPWGQATPTDLVPVLADPLHPARSWAIEHLARRGEVEALTAIVQGDQPGPAAAALAALGDFATSAARLIEVAQPLAHAAALRIALTRAHRRGVFVQSTDLVPLLPFFVAHRAWPAEDFADLCHVARDALVERIAARPLDDPAWPRLLSVLAVSSGRGASAAIRGVLAGPAPAATLRAAIEAAGLREDTEAEALVLAHLEHFTPEALAALTRLGGAATARTLQSVLGLGEEPPAPWLLAWQTPALLLLWQLTPARSAARAQLLQRINPTRMPPAITRDVAAERSEAARRLALNAALFLRPDKAIIRLADLGEDSAFDTLYGLLRECVVGLFNGSIPGDSPLDTAHTAGRPDLPAKVRDALLAYGRTLAARGRIRPVCLTRGGEPGAAIFVEICLDLAGYGGLEPGMQRCLLHAITPYAAPHTLPRIKPLVRSRDPAVRAAAVRLFVARAHETRPHAVARLLRDDSEATVRPALAAVAEFAVRWATPWVAERLRDERPGVVQAAAEALVRMNAAEALPLIVEQLARCDDPHVCGPLIEAYEAATHRPWPLVDAFAEARDPAVQRRLLDALAGRLRAAWLVHLLRRNRPLGVRLLAAVRAGALVLDGSLESLHLAGVRQGVEAAQSTSDDPTVLLFRKGWTDSRGHAALVAPGAPVDRIVKAFGWECIDALPALSPAVQAKVTHALARLRGKTIRLWRPTLLQHAPAVKGPLAMSGLLRAFMRIGAELPLAIKGRIVDAIRAVPGGGVGDALLRVQTLRRLGAILQRSDIVAALADAQVSEPEPVDMRQTLAEMFDARVEPVLATLPRGAPITAELIDALIAAVGLPADDTLNWLGEPVARLRAAPIPPPVEATSQAGVQRAIEALGDPDEAVRAEAATRLLDWPDAVLAHREVLMAWLKGDVEVPVDRQWALAEALDARPRLIEGVPAIELLEWLSLERRRRHAARLWRIWLAPPNEDAAVRDAAGTGLRRLGAAFLLPRAAQAIEEGCWQAADLLTAGPLPRCPQLDDVVEHLRLAGQEVRADTLMGQAVVGPLGTPAPPPLPKRVRHTAPAQQALVDAAQGDDPQAARRALQALLEAKDPDTVPLLVKLTRHPDPARRMLALRAVRQLADAATYLDAALPFLDDPRTDVRRSVIEALSAAQHPAALPRLIELLRDPTRAIREAARNGLIHYGADAVAGVQTALRRAHPDQRAIYARVLAALEDLLAAEADLASPPTTL